MLLPPTAFIAGRVVFGVMNCTKRNRELITYFEAQSPRLREAQMMGVCRCPTADQTGVLSDEAQMLL